MPSRRLGGPAALAAVLGLAAAVRLATLGAYFLTDTTEARYAEVAREMLAGGDWLVPRIWGGHPFWAKPVLSTWLTAASFAALGVNEFAARFPSFLTGAATAFLTWRVARRLHGPGIALTSVVVLVTGAVFFLMSGAVLTDPALGLATTMSFAGLVFALADAGTARGRAAGYLFFAGLGVGLLAKGPIAVVLCVAPPAAWALWKRRVGDVLRRLPWATGTLLALAICVPWYWAAEVRTPGFLRYFLVGEHVHRFLDPDWAGDLYGSPRTKARGLIWALGLASVLPWSLVLLPPLFGVVRRGREAWRRFADDPWAPLLVLWALAPVAFFTPSGSAMIYYVLPGLPAFSILAARLLCRGAPDGLPVRRRTFLAAAAFVPVAVAAALPFVAPLARREHSQVEWVRLAEAEGGGADALAYAVEDKDLPCSADFYSAGAVRHMGSAGEDDWAALLRETGPRFVVTHRGHARDLPQAVRSRLRPVAEAERLELWRVGDER